jgi:RimJ/RimL family protein N-acetyltransferase
MRTERLLLRPMTNGDVDDVYAYQSLEDVCRYLPFEARTHDQVAENVAKHATALVLSGDGDYWRLAMELADDPGHVIGDVFFTIKDLGNATCEIGWTMHPDQTGAGYMTEAASAVLDIAFGQIGLHRAIATLDPRNDRSAALCERLGMRREALFVEDTWFRGKWGDTLICGIVEREWAARTG